MKVMTFAEWLFSLNEKPIIENPEVNGRWGLLHILTLVLCVGLILAFYFIVKKSKNKEKASKIIIIVLASLILFFEFMMRFVRFTIYWDDMTVYLAFWILLPRPWCALSCWALMISVLVNKKFFYNFASISALLCALIFFACPGVGFNNKYILFDNLYSIATHALLLVMSISLITLKFTDFRYKGIWKEAICFAATFLWSAMTISLGFERDPMYFMPNGDIQAGIFGIPYGVYMVIYVVFLLLFINTFYLINDRKNVKKVFMRNKKVAES